MTIQISALIIHKKYKWLVKNDDCGLLFLTNVRFCILIYLKTENGVAF